MEKITVLAHFYFSNIFLGGKKQLCHEAKKFPGFTRSNKLLNLRFLSSKKGSQTLGEVQLKQPVAQVCLTVYKKSIYPIEVKLEKKWGKFSCHEGNTTHWLLVEMRDSSTRRVGVINVKNEFELCKSLFCCGRRLLLIHDDGNTRYGGIKTTHHFSSNFKLQNKSCAGTS